MKFHPTIPGNPQREKTKFIVTIEDETYPTSAFNEEGAKSNAAYRYGQDEDMDIGLVLHKIKKGELFCEVEEV